MIVEDIDHNSGVATVYRCQPFFALKKCAMAIGEAVDGAVHFKPNNYLFGEGGEVGSLNVVAGKVSQLN